jgi:stage III sporulation protein AH
LVVVLSVYYIQSPEPKGNEFATTGNEENTTEDTGENAETKTENEDTVTTIDSDEVFDQLRLDVMEQRSRKEGELTLVMGSADSTAEEKSAAKDEITKLRELTDNEKIMETLIKADNYDDVLVRTGEDGTVNVTIKAEELSPEAANDIVQLVRKNLDAPNAIVAVKIDPK